MTLTTSNKLHRGFTLIEVLIALFVFAIGILTVAGLETISKKANFDAVQRTTATQLAADIVARMRANSADVWGNYESENLGGSSLSAPSPSCAGTTANCSPTQMVAYDLYQWEQAIDGVAEAKTGGLVDPKACIRGPATGGAGTYYVIIAWRGVTELSSPDIDADIPPSSGNAKCGAGNYDTNDAYRRVLMFTTFMAE